MKLSWNMNEEGTIEIFDLDLPVNKSVIDVWRLEVENSREYQIGLAQKTCAAPELLEALEEARQEIRKDWCDTEEEFKERRIIQKIDAVIAKAKGGVA